MDNVVNGYLDLISTIRVMTSITAVGSIMNDLLNSSSIIVDGGRSRAERDSIERKLKDVIDNLNNLEEYLNKVYKDVGFIRE